MKPVTKADLLAALDRCFDRGKGPKSPILVVEDDSETREFIAELFREKGHSGRHGS